MVLQVTTWRKKILSVAISHYTPDMFVKSQWQKRRGISMYYLIYRWVMASVFFSILFASVVELGRPRGDMIHYVKWVIYLTHWGLVACVMQAILAAYFVTRARCKHPDEEIEAMKMNCWLRIYWALYTTSTICAFGITIIYWNFVYNPAYHKLDAVNILVHAFNSVLMLIDLMVVAHPIRLVDFYWPLSFALSYMVFSISYYLAGGTDRKGHHFVYRIIDWAKPLRTVLIIQVCILLLLVMHIIACCICFLRSKMAEVLRRREAERRDKLTKNMQGIANEVPVNDAV